MAKPLPQLQLQKRCAYCGPPAVTVRTIRRDQHRAREDRAELRVAVMPNGERLFREQHERVRRRLPPPVEAPEAQGRSLPGELFLPPFGQSSSLSLFSAA
jgi:hypothetical protein